MVNTARGGLSDSQTQTVTDCQHLMVKKGVDGRKGIRTEEEWQEPTRRAIDVQTGTSSSSFNHFLLHIIIKVSCEEDFLEKNLHSRKEARVFLSNDSRIKRI